MNSNREVSVDVLESLKKNIIYTFVIFILLTYFSKLNRFSENFSENNFFLEFAFVLLEEFIFRVKLYTYLKRNNSAMFSAVVSSIIFSLAHIQYYQKFMILLHLFIHGFGLAVIYDFTNSILIISLMHFLNNNFLLFLPDNSFSALFSTSQAVYFIMAIFIVYFSVKKTPVTLESFEQSSKSRKISNLTTNMIFQIPYILLPTSIILSSVQNHNEKKVDLVLCLYLIFVVIFCFLLNFIGTTQTKRILVTYFYINFLYVCSLFVLRTFSPSSFYIELIFIYTLPYLILLKDNVVPKIERILIIISSTTVFSIGIIKKATAFEILLVVSLVLILLIRFSDTLYNFLAFSISSLITNFCPENFSLSFIAFWRVYLYIIILLFSIRYYKLYHGEN